MSQASPRSGEYSNTAEKAFKPVGRPTFCGSAALSGLRRTEAVAAFSRLDWSAEVEASFEPATDTTGRRSPNGRLCETIQAACAANSNPMIIRAMRVRIHGEAKIGEGIRCGGVVRSLASWVSCRSEVDSRSRAVADRL